MGRVGSILPALLKRSGTSVAFDWVPCRRAASPPGPPAVQPKPMARDDSRPSHDSERRSGNGRGRATAGPQARRGNSGYGMDSIRRNLRVQLEQRRLLRPGSPWDEDDRSNDPS